MCPVQFIISAVSRPFGTPSTKNILMVRPVLIVDDSFCDMVQQSIDAALSTWPNGLYDSWKSLQIAGQACGMID